MPMIPDDEIARIKQATDLAALVRSRGVALAGGAGGNLAGLCPFHDDRKPSFIVTPAKGLFRCMSPACGAAGNAIQFIMRKDGVSFRHAVELLRAPGAAAFTAAPRTARALPPPVAREADDRTLLRQVVDYYHERLLDPLAGRAAREYLQSRGLGSGEAIRAHKIGFADRTLGLRLPNKQRVAGADIRARLERLGIYRGSGHEHFNGCVVFPILGAAGEIAGIYGRRIAARQAAGIHHLYLPGPHRGLWNRDALKSREVILCEALLDALTYWENGYTNATAAYGAEGFTQEMEDAFCAAKLDRVYIAFDRDEAGELGANKVAARLMARGIECRRVLFPHGQDANDYARKTTPANKALAVLLNAAAFIGRGSSDRGAAPNPGRVADPAPVDAPALRAAASPLGEVSPRPEVPADTGSAHAPRTRAFSLAAEAAFVAAAPAQPAPPEEEAAKEENNNVPAGAPAQAGDAVVSADGDEAALRFAGREWLARGLLKNAGLETLKVTLRLSCAEGVHVDALDLVRDAERRRFVKRAAEETRLHPDLLRREIGRVLLALERAQAARLQAQARPAPGAKAPPAERMTPREREDALALLRDPKLLDRIKTDFAACGVVGEETNKLVGYLAAVSRKLERPLAVIVQSTSAAGKTALMEAVLAFVPPEERVKYSALTGQALYYMADADLKNKILAIVEEEGAEKASYALKLLQSEGELTIASTGKDPHTGRMETQEYRVEGPVMIFLTTTAVDIDEELLNRCLVLTVDEGREQTAAIHRLQRQAETLDGLLRAESRAQLLALHRNAQRLLRPLRVVNPFAEKLTFLDDRTRTRRDHTKYLALIRVIALLHQHQREVKTVWHAGLAGGRIEYIEAAAGDIAAANALAHEVLGRCLDEMPPQTRRLLALLEKMVGERCAAARMERADVRFSRRAAREYTGWGNSQLHVHLQRLAELEYLVTHRAGHGNGFVYELVYDGGGKDGRRFLPGLLDIAAAGRPGQNGAHPGQNSARPAPVRPASGGNPAPIRPAKNGAFPSENTPQTAKSGKNAHLDGAARAGIAGVDAGADAGRKP